MATKHQEKDTEKLVAEAAADEPLVPSPKETAKAKAKDADDRIDETMVVTTPGADIAATSGTLAGDFTGTPLSGTVERTPIVGQPEVVVVDGLDADAPRLGPAHERDRQARETGAKQSKA